MNRDDVITVVCKAVAEFNLSQPEDRRLRPELEAPLLGSGAILDSSSLVALIVTVEEYLEEEFGMCGALTSEKAMSQTHSPFRTIGTLVDYVVQEEFVL